VALEVQVEPAASAEVPVHRARRALPADPASAAQAARQRKIQFRPREGTIAIID